MADILVLALIAAALVRAVWKCVSDKKNGKGCLGCSGDCRTCGGRGKEN